MALDHAKTPSVSIGLPVRNGEEGLRIAIDSLLAQDHRDFELVISDNASDDGTHSICLEYSRRDPRIRVHRNDTNVGAAENFNHVFRLSRGKYFMWAAHDDRWHPSFLKRCLEELERNPKVVLCGSAIRFVDESGIELDRAAPLRRLIGDYNRLDTVSMNLIERVKELTKRVSWYSLYGLFRADQLRRTGLVPNCFGGDVLLLLEVLFQGETMVLPDALFDYRCVKKSAEMQVEEISGTSSQVDTLKAYTVLATKLLGAIDKADCSNGVKKRLREDLLENVSFANQTWADQIVAENRPNVVSDNRLVASFQIRDLLAGRPVRAPEALREAEFRKSLTGLSAAVRLRRNIRRTLDRHVMWRFRQS